MSHPPFELTETPLSRGVTLIEASAGTGKTYALATIFLRLVVEDGLQAGQILVTTYTVPATAELRDRIRKLLHTAYEGWMGGSSEHPIIQTLIEAERVTPELAQRRLLAALRAFDEAAIQTIHGFCQRVLQDRAFESRIPFDAALITDQSTLIREIAEDYWRKHLHTASPAFAAAALLHKLTPEKLGKLLSNSGSHAQLRILPHSTGHASLKAQLDEFFTEFRQSWPGWREQVRGHFLIENAWAKGPYAKTEEMDYLLALVDECAAGPDASLDCYSALDRFTSPLLAKETRAKQTAPAHDFYDLCHRLSELRSKVGVTIEADFLTWARAELPRMKARRNVVHFDDLLIRLQTALNGESGPALANAVRARFPAALIDEFQDTDPVQEEIFRTIFAPPQHRLYLIGDPKQAIYGFRGADVFSYLASARRADRAFQLGTNYRSASALVAGVNAVFERPASPFIVDEISFQPVLASERADAEPLRVGGEARSPLRLWLPEFPEPVTSGKAMEELPGRVAAEIARLLDGRAQLGELPLFPPNIAILTATNPQARAMQDALSKLKIPSVLLSSASVFKSREAVDLHTVLAAAADPLRESLVRAALATRLLGLDAAEIDSLITNEVDWEHWLIRFQTWHAAWRDRGFIQMFRALLRETHLRPKLIGLPEGERVLTNVLHLGELLHRVAAEQRLSPDALVHWLAERRRDEGAPAEEHEMRLERDEDAVRIVTIHKSKGLEYDVVFCPFGWGKAELRSNERALFHDTDSGELSLDLGSENLGASEALATREKLAEQTRLLYVALTRAKYECHFVWGRFSKCEVSAALWLLHPCATGSDPLEALAARGAALDAAALRGEIEAFAASAPEAMAAVDWPPPEAPAYRPPARVTPHIEAREFHGTIERDWRVTSFSALTEHLEEEARDLDREAVPDQPIDTGVTPAGIHAFPAGKTAGVCLHAIFEELDFTRPGDVASIVERKLGTFGFTAPEWKEPVIENVRQVLEVELESGLRLAQVPMSARLNELEFHFPIARIEAAELTRVLEAGKFTFDTRRGLMRGFIDLVFEHEGRFYIADWKSNRLGPETASYAQAALAQSMTEHRYHLQYHLYALALHRYLSVRIGAAYDYEQHFGGVFYLFLRGIDPARPELGVFRDRPSIERINALDALFSDEP